GLERGEECREIQSPAPKLYEAIGFGLAFWSGTFDILDVKEEQAIGIPLHGLRRIAARLRVVCRVQLELHESRVRGLQNVRNFVGGLPQCPHVVVITDRDAK